MKHPSPFCPYFFFFQRSPSSVSRVSLISSCFLHPFTSPSFLSCSRSTNGEYVTMTTHELSMTYHPRSHPFFVYRARAYPSCRRYEHVLSAGTEMSHNFDNASAETRHRRRVRRENETHSFFNDPSAGDAGEGGGERLRITRLSRSRPRQLTWSERRYIARVPSVLITVDNNVTGARCFHNRISKCRNTKCRYVNTTKLHFPEDHAGARV